MAITKSFVTLLSSVSAAAGGTKASPGQTSSVFDCNSYYRGSLTYSITNGGTLTTAGSITFQISGDGSTNWRDLATVGGDLVSGSTYTGAVDLPSGTKYLRVIVYGNVGAAVTVSAELQAVTGL